VMTPLHGFAQPIFKLSSAVCLQRLLFLVYVHLLTRCKFSRSYPGLGFTTRSKGLVCFYLGCCRERMQDLGLIVRHEKALDSPCSATRCRFTFRKMPSEVLRIIVLNCMNHLRPYSALVPHLPPPVVVGCTL
jgi:hypothetical protein